MSNPSKIVKTAHGFNPLHYHTNINLIIINFSRQYFVFMFLDISAPILSCTFGKNVTVFLHHHYYYLIMQYTSYSEYLCEFSDSSHNSNDFHTWYKYIWRWIHTQSRNVVVGMLTDPPRLWDMLVGLFPLFSRAGVLQGELRTFVSPSDGRFHPSSLKWNGIGKADWIGYPHPEPRW